MACAFLACAGRADDNRIEPIFWMANEIESAHISMGRVKTTQPEWNIDTGLGARYRRAYVLAGFWTASDFTGHARDRHVWYFHELDPGTWAGYDWAIAEGFSLDSRLGMQWNYMSGYWGDNRRSYDEWQMSEKLRTPWLDVCYSMRNFYYPVAKASFRLAFSHSFALTENLSLEPMLWFDGGSARWNRQRFGSGDPKSIGAGVNSGTLRLFLNYRIGAGFSVYGGIAEYCALDPDVRRELQDTQSDFSMPDLFYATIGIKWSI